MRDVCLPPQRPARTRSALDGVLLLDKPIGPSSSRVLGHVKHLFSAVKAGHGGTLDPMASGLLPILFGEATKYASEGLTADKTYVAEIYLGSRTSTGDAEGEVIEQSEVKPVDAVRLHEVINGFAGKQRQTPPMFSAVKKDGRALYSYARKGEEVEREAREIVIHEIGLLAADWPVLTVRILCSKGTYVRVLAEDIGKALGMPAHLKALRRTAVGALGAKDMVSLDDIERAPDHKRCEFLKPVDWLIRDWPLVTLGQTQCRRFVHGQPVMADASAHQGLVRVETEQGEFLGTGRFNSQAMLLPERVRVMPAREF